MRWEKSLRVWRSAPLTRRFCWALVVIASCVAAWLLTFPPVDAVNSRIDFVVLASVCLLTALAAYRGGIRSCIIATPSGLLLRNVTFSRRIPWHEITDLAPSKNGIVISRGEKWPVTAWAVQEAPITVMLGRTSRAEEICREIRDMARNYGAPLAQHDD